MPLVNNKTWWIGLGAVVFAGCAACKITVDQVPPVPRTTIQTETSEGEVTGIHRKEKDGAVFYKVEFKRAGREYEIKVNEAGEVVKREEAMKLEELPAPVQETAKRESAGGTDLEYEKETKEGKTFYEVEFKKDGKEHEVEINPDGSILKKESK